MGFPSHATRLAATFSAVVMLVAGCSREVEPDAVQASPSPSSSPSSSAPPPAPPCGVDELKAMSLREKLAQRLVVGVTGADDARAIVDSEQLGGIFVGTWTDLGMLQNGQVKKISDAGKTPLMVTVDQEGGRVNRLADLGVDMPSARSLVASGVSAQEARAQAKSAGEKMREMGITVDFAPIVDVSDQDDDTVIGDRSFSNDPKVVTEYAGAVAAGLEEAGIQPVYKHFPGHGHGSGDSHTGVVRTPPLSELEKSDLVPYKELLKEPGNAAVMMGHLIVPGLTAPDTPASISGRAIGMLRSGEPYGGTPFDGVVFTDDLSGMAAITDKYPIEEAVLRAFRAGADIGLWLSTDQVPSVLDRLEAAVAEGRLSEKRIDASVVRILKAKGVLACG